MKKTQKKIGLGSTSILLFIAGILFSFTFKNGVCIGDEILNSIGLKAWSNGTQGTHYTIFYSLVFFISSVFIGYKFNHNIGSKLGRILSLIMLGIVAFMLFFMIRI